jgi:hypothetical protein
MEEVSTFMQMERNTLGNGVKAKSTAKVLTFIPMVKHMMETTKMVQGQDMESILMLLVDSMLVSF